MEELKNWMTLLSYELIVWSWVEVRNLLKKIKCFQERAEIFWKDTLFRITIFEYLYLIMFGIYLLFYFFNTTMFKIQWPANFLENLHMVSCFVILFRFISMDYVDLKHSALIWIIFPVLIIAYRHVDYNELLNTALLLVGAYRIDYKKIFKVYLSVSVPITIYTVIASQIGLVKNLIYHQKGRIRESFGFVYPTDFAAHIFFMIVVWVLLRQLKCTYIELGIMFLLTMFLHFNCDTRCSEITILLMVALVTFLKITNFKREEKEVTYQISNLIKIGCCISPIVFSAIMMVLCRFYNPDNYFMSMINKALTQRLRLGKKTFDYFDTKLFGQYIEMIGNGGKTEKPVDYTFIDCSYINILMRFGLLVFIVVLLLIEIIMIKNIDNAFILIAMTIICLHSVVEHHLFEFYYNIFIILPLASFQNGKINYLSDKIYE